MPVLISSPGKIWLSVAPADLRRGIDGLSAQVALTLGQKPCEGSAFVFRNAAGNRNPASHPGQISTGMGG